MCKPSEIVLIPSVGTKTPPPIEAFKSVVIPELLIYWTVFPAPVWKSPWTLLITSSFVPAIPTKDNLRFLPKVSDPIWFTESTSPSE